MKIKANTNFKGILDLSSREELYNKNPIEGLPFRLTIKPGQTICVDDKWYTLKNIQSALKTGYIEILDFKEQHVFAEEIKIPESHTTYYDLTLVEILNRADYPQDAFKKINQNFVDIDAIIHAGGGGGATNFTQLLDVPHSYIGQSHKIVYVNNNANGLDFANIYVYSDHLNVGSNSNPMNLNVFGVCNVASLTIQGRKASNIPEILIGLPDGTTCYKKVIDGIICDL